MQDAEYEKGKANILISRGPTLSEQVYDYVREQIISGVYLPGQIISESELAQTLEVSRTPVSIALTILLERGLLEQKNSKFAVPVLTIKDVVDLYTCRLAFDGLATRLAAETISDEELKRLERHLEVWENPPEEDDLHALWVADLGFHEIIYEVSNNRHLIRFAQIAAELAAVYRRNTIRRLETVDTRSREDVRLEHQRIFEALASHNPKRAESAARKHIKKVIKQLKQMEVVDTEFSLSEA